MKHSLLLLGVVAVLAIGAPAYSQHIYMDTNNDGQCTNADVLSSATTTVDIYLDTNHNADASTQTCNSNPAKPLDMFSYDIILHYSGSGSVTFNSYTHNAALLNYGLISAFTTAGQDVGVGYTKSSGSDGPGLFKLGTFNITVTGSPVLTFQGLSPNISIPSPFTGFGTSCDATAFASSYVLSVDFNDNCGTAAPTPVQSTTWGKIKQLYH